MTTFRTIASGSSGNAALLEAGETRILRSEEHTSELQSLS